MRPSPPGSGVGRPSPPGAPARGGGTPDPSDPGEIPILDTDPDPGVLGKRGTLGSVRTEREVRVKKREKKSVKSGLSGVRKHSSCIVVDGNRSSKPEYRSSGMESGGLNILLDS